MTELCKKGRELSMEIGAWRRQRPNRVSSWPGMLIMADDEFVKPWRSA